MNSTHQFSIGTSVFLVLALCIISSFYPSTVSAQQCYPQRVINQRRCLDGEGVCQTWTSAAASISCQRSASTAPNARAKCEAECNAPENDCQPAYCASYSPIDQICGLQEFNAGCTAAPSCHVTANIVTCTQSGTTCSESPDPLNYECWDNSTSVDPEGCTSGECIQNVGSCSEAGRQNGSGSCTGGLCCQAISSYVPGCSYNGGQLAYSACQWSEGGGCDGSCRPPIAQPGSDCRTDHCPDGSGVWNFATNNCPNKDKACADGLVGSGCLCPSCNTRFNPRNLVLAPGEIANVDIVNKPTNWKRYGVVYPIANPGTDRDPTQDLRYIFRYNDNGSGTSTNTSTVATANLRANNNQIRIIAGATPDTRTRIQVNLRYVGYDTRVLCSNFITVEVKTPQINCPAMGTITSTFNKCDTYDASDVSGTPIGDGVATFTWESLAGVTHYDISVTNTGSADLTDVVTVPCSSGTCTHTKTDIIGSPVGYRAWIKPSLGTCIPPNSYTASSNPAQIIPFCPATINVVGKTVPANTSCAAIISSPVSDNTADLSFTIPNLTPITKQQSGTDPVTWTGVTGNVIPPGPYTVNSGVPPAGFTQDTKICWSKTDVAPATGTGGSTSILSFQTLDWYIPYISGTPWVRVVGGDVTACNDISSPIPPATIPRYFMTSSTVGTPGVVTYWNNYDFDPAPGSNGPNYVSAPPYNWLVKEKVNTTCSTPWYNFLFNKYGLSGVDPDYTNPAPVTLDDFDSQLKPYIVSGNLSTQPGQPWNITANTNRVIFVTGDLTINSPVTITGKALIAFVVAGNINIGPDVGSTIADTSPDLEGIYITNGQFNTGLSSNAPTAKLIVNGSVIAGSVNLERNLDAIDGNTQPAEEFRYNPMLMFSLPNEFMDMKIKWEEVAP